MTPTRTQALGLLATLALTACSHDAAESAPDARAQTRQEALYRTPGRPLAQYALALALMTRGSRRTTPLIFEAFWKRRNSTSKASHRPLEMDFAIIVTVKVSPPSSSNP